MDWRQMNNIENIWQFLENLNEYVYATDIETNELVYMNRKALDAYELKSLEEIKGRKCYEVLQKSSTPCGICNNDRLCVGAFEEWRYYNPVIDKYLLLKDTLIADSARKKKYRIEIAIDISEERSQNKVIQKYRDMGALVNEGLKVALSADTPDETIQIILEYLGKSLSGERTYIFEKNENGCDDNTYEWTAAGIKPEKANLQNLPPEICANWYHCFDEGKCIVIQDLEEMRESDPLQYENLKRQGIHSIVVVPIYDKGKVIAFYGVDNPPPMLLEYTFSMLQIMGSFLVSCIRRRNLMRKLEALSYKDALTQLGNRFAMNNYVQQINKQHSIGIVYCDITGLKQENDTVGHQMGDQLILRASACLTKVFGDYGVFRIGGDELLVICSPIDQDTLAERVSRLRELMKENSVNMAIGTVWADKVSTDLDVLLRESEKQMYQDKAEYYRKSGIERRRH